MTSPAAEMITVPYGEHGSTTLSDCGLDFTNAFFLSPGEELNLACVEAMRPVFVLPDDALPEAPTPSDDLFDMGS